MPRNRIAVVDWPVVWPQVRHWLATELPRRRDIKGVLVDCARAFSDAGVTVARLQCFLYKTQPLEWIELKKLVGSALDEGRSADGSAQPPPPPRPQPLEPDHPELRLRERQVADLTSELERTRRKLREADRQQSVVAQLVEVMRQEIQPIPYVPATIRGRRTDKESVDAVALLNDEHADRVISGASTWGLERYDYNVFRCRLTRWVNLITDYVTRWLAGSDYVIERLWVFKLGDSLHGDIHNMKHRNHFANTVRAALAVGDAEAQALAALAPIFPGGVHMVGVSGNHPRQTQKPDEDPHDNMDFAVGSVIALRCADLVRAGQMSVHLPRAWSAYVNVRGWGCALNHGQDVRGTWGIPWYGFSRREGRVQALLAQHNQRMHYFFYGHFHTPITRTEQGAKGIHGGAWYFTDAYASERLAVGNEPEHPLILFNEQRGRIHEIPLYVRDPEAEERLRAGLWEPPFGRRTVLDEVGESDAMAERGMFPLIRAPESAA